MFKIKCLSGVLLSTIEKKVSIFNVRALVTCEIMHNKNVQCNTA